MKLSQIAKILDDITECDIWEEDYFDKPRLANVIGTEIHGKYYDGIRLENCPVVGMWVDEDRGYNLQIVIDMTYHRDKKRREKEKQNASRV